MVYRGLENVDPQNVDSTRVMRAVTILRTVTLGLLCKFYLKCGKSATNGRRKSEPSPRANEQRMPEPASPTVFHIPVESSLSVRQRPDTVFHIAIGVLRERLVPDFAL